MALNPTKYAPNALKIANVCILNLSYPCHMTSDHMTPCREDYLRLASFGKLIIWRFMLWRSDFTAVLIGNLDRKWSPEVNWHMNRVI